MKKRNKIIAALLVVVILAGGSYMVADKMRLKDKLWLSMNVKATEVMAEQKGYLEISNEKNVSNLNLDYQKTVTDKIDKLRKSNDYTIMDPLLILNPYGTNTCSLNVYFDATEPSYLEYTIKDPSGTYKDFTRRLYNGGENNLTEKHAYQVTGFIAEMENELVLTLYNEDGMELATSQFKVVMPALESGIGTSVTMEEGTSDAVFANGLFCLLGHDKAFNSNIYMYDDEGVLRGEIPLTKYRTDRIFNIDDQIVFSYDENKIAFVNRLGEITKKYSFKGYKLHHDFAYDEVNNKIVMLATEKGQYTIEDIVIALDLKTGETKELIDFKDLMPEAYEMSSLPEDKDKLDWIHFNTIDVINEKEILLSARENSTIICVDNVYDNPTLKYFISDKSIWEGTVYEDLVYEKVGDFTAQGGQHTVTYVPDESLPDGQYYLHMYNNNLAYWPTNPEFDWSAYKGTGTTKKGDASKYYRYLVDETAKTFTLVKSFDVPYSPFVSSTQELGDNYVTSSGFAHQYGEYDTNGELIRSYEYESEKYTYRVFKYDFENFWFVY